MKIVKGTNKQGKEFYIMKGPFVLQNVFGIVSHISVRESYEYINNLKDPYDSFEPSSFLNNFELEDMVEFESAEEFTNVLKLNKRVLIIPEEDIEIMQRLYKEQFPERFI